MSATVHPEPLALRDSAEVDAWERCYLQVISMPILGDLARASDAISAADTFIRERRKRVKARAEPRARERVVKLRAELKRLVDELRGGFRDLDADHAQEVLDADENDFLPGL